MAQINLIKRIETVIQASLLELGGNNELVSLLQQFSQIPHRLNEPMQLAIVGKISSSKSTLVNAILGEEEVVRTGAMEETWNVSWLKYGSDESDILVHYKDGREESVPRSNWAKWANRERNEHEKLKDIVSYIEVAYQHEILKLINIIDTPGLDSFYGKDSQNTLDFLKQVRPDAVIMLFSKSIHADTLAIIDDFRQGVGSGLSPINAMAVMSKIDNIWASNPDLIPLKEAKKISARLMSIESVRNTLFNIFPLSAMVALAASSITSAEFDSIKQLAQIDEDTWDDMLASEGRFVAEYDDVPLSPEIRTQLRNKIGRFALFLMVEKLQENPHYSINQLQDVLYEASGFAEFMETLQSHFGERSTLIKSYSSIFALSVQCREKYHQLQKNVNCPTASAALVKLHRVIELIDELIRGLTIEYNLVGIMKEIYEGKLEIDNYELEELRRANGEFGYACTTRLGLSQIEHPQELIEASLQKINYWLAQYNIDSEFDPEKARCHKLLVSIYLELLSEIKSAIYKYNTSSHFLFNT